ncbi:MAG: class I SAM-dependent DNA methyltransferase [Paracoccaceae bacterium]
MAQRYLDKVYATEGAEATRELYDDWADSYDAELKAAGYVTPARIAAALGAHLDDRQAEILDFGCGTGLSGEALARAGFTNVDGVDLSAEMLEEARAKGIYRDLAQIAPDDMLEDRAGRYAAITATGVIGAGAAPVECFDRLMHLLPPGGLFVFSFNDHTLQDPAFEARVSEWTDGGAARLHFREHGAHVPEKDLGATVYVLEKR